MIRCGNCKVIQKDGAVTCTACGRPTGAAAPEADPSASSPTGAVLPNQVPRGAPGTTGPVLPNQTGRGPTPAGPAPVGNAPTAPTPPAPVPAPPPAPTPPSAPAAPAGSAAFAPTTPPTPGAPPVAPPVRHAGPVVLGPASDPGAGARTSGSFPGVGTGAPTGPNPVVVGPAPKEPDHNKGLKIAAIVGSSLVLVLLVALVVVLAGRGTTVETGGSTTTSSSTSTSSTTTTTTAPTTTAVIPATLNLAAYGRGYTTGEPIDVPVGFTGDPNAIESTELHLNGLPHERVPGLKTNFTVETPLPGNVRIKIVIKLKNGETRESNEVQATITVPTTTAPPPPPPTTEPPRRTCYGCVVLRLYSGLSEVSVRDRPTRASRDMYKVHSGSYLEGECWVTGERVTYEGTTSDHWTRLADGNYIWDGFVANGLPRC